jgi:hypothetical protein
MPENEICESALRTTGDLAGVFEYDGETGYFYLYLEKVSEGQKVVASIRVLTGNADFQQEDISIDWDTDEKMVGLFIRGQVWAVFEGQSRAKYGGNYKPHSQPLIPEEIVRAFERKK